jgi:hypothetical protein
LRHAHDLVSTTYGQDLLFNRFNLYQNLPFILSKMADYVSLGPNRKVGLPISSDNAFIDFASPEIGEITTRFRKFNDNLAAFNNPKIASNLRFSVRDILEASAIGTQLDFVFDMFGKETHDRFYMFISRSRGAATYLRMLTNFSERLEDAGFRGYGGGAAHGQVIWYALNGSTSRGRLVQDVLSSVVLYEALVEQLIGNVARKGNDTTIREWVSQSCSEFFEDWGLLQADEMSARTAKRVSDRAARAKRAVEEAFGDAEMQPGLKVVEYNASLYQKMSSDILSSDTEFFSQRTYVAQTVLGRYPAVAVKVKSDQVLHDFLSVGYTDLDFVLLNEVTMISMLFDIFLWGRHVSGCPALEEMYFRSLLNEGWNGRKLKFQDQSDIFKW